MNTMKAKHFHLIEDMDIAALTFAAIERVEAFASDIKAVVKTWARRSNDRRQLAMMNERMLEDIGLTSHEVRAEVAKYFWQK
ncbi:MAG: DUF1127 domain-containing protein [Gammaproteobacteria bacterium]|nr:DUF1127 domain-containing protein [Gammaproteobacteria bacterium]